MNGEDLSKGRRHGSTEDLMRGLLYNKLDFLWVVFSVTVGIVTRAWALGNLLKDNLTFTSI